MEKSLVARRARGAETQLALLETLRVYAAGRLSDEELRRLRRAHAEHYLRLAEGSQWEPLDIDSVEWLQVVEDSLDNVRAALQWLGSVEEPDWHLRVVTSLAVFWRARGYITEGRRELERALRRPGGAPELRAAVELNAGWHANFQHDSASARAHFERSLEFYEGRSATFTASALSGLGVAAHEEKRFAEGREHFRRALEIARREGDRWQAAKVLNNLAGLAWQEGNYREAQRCLQEVIALMRAEGRVADLPLAFYNLAQNCIELGDWQHAHESLVEALPLAERTDHRRALATIFEGCAQLAAHWGQPAIALRLDGAASALRQRIGYVQLPPLRVRYERRLDTARRQLGPAQAARAWQAGAAMPLEVAIREAARIRAEGKEGRAADGTAGAAGQLAELTPRERQVAILMGEGLSNRDIAHELAISQRTVEAHGDRIREKLGVHSRAEIAARLGAAAAGAALTSRPT